MAKCIDHVVVIDYFLKQILLFITRQQAYRHNNNKYYPVSFQPNTSSQRLLYFCSFITLFPLYHIVPHYIVPHYFLLLLFLFLFSPKLGWKLGLVCCLVITILDSVSDITFKLRVLKHNFIKYNEREGTTYPYAIKNQRKARNAPSRGHFVPKPPTRGALSWFFMA